MAKVLDKSAVSQEGESKDTRTYVYTTKPRGITSALEPCDRIPFALLYVTLLKLWKERTADFRMEQLVFLDVLNLHLKDCWGA